MNGTVSVSDILPYFLGLFRTNYFTLILLVFLAATALWKYLPRISLQGLGRLLHAHPVRFLIGVVLIGSLLRVGWISFCEYRPAFAHSDAVTKSQNLIEQDGINIYAASIPQGKWFLDADGRPLARRPIGYPMLLGGVYALFGASAPVLYAFNLLLFAACVVLVYLLTEQMFGRAAGLVAAAVYGIYPVAIYSHALALDEHLFLPLWYAGIFLLFRQIKGKPVSWAPLWYGLIFGYATITRTHTIFMPVVVAYVYLAARGSWKKAVFAAIAVFVIGQLMVVPWGLRNQRAFGVYVPYTATNADVYHGCNPAMTRGDDNGYWPRSGDAGYDPVLVEALKNYDVPVMQKRSTQALKHYVLTQPGHFLILGVEKWLHFLGVNRKTGVWAIDLIEESKQRTPEKKIYEPVRHVFEEFAFGAYYLLFFTCIAGVVWIARTWNKRSAVERRSLVVAGLCFFFYLAEQLIIYPERKYRFPLEPIMMTVAAGFLVFLAKDFRLSCFKKL